MRFDTDLNALFTFSMKNNFLCTVSNLVEPSSVFNHEGDKATKKINSVYVIFGQLNELNK